MIQRLTFAPALLIGVLLFLPGSASGRIHVTQRVRKSATQLRQRFSRLRLRRLGTTFKRVELKRRLTSLGDSTVGRTTRRVMTPITPLNARRAGAKDRAPHLGQRGRLNLKPVARNFTTRRARLNYASGLLGRSLTQGQQAALIEAHRIGYGDKGANGRKAQISASGKGNYTIAQLREKARILRKAGFSGQETRMLMERGVVGTTNAIIGASMLSSGILLMLTSETPMAGMPMVTLGALWMSGLFGDF